MLTLGELRGGTCVDRHASPASIWFCWPSRPLRYTCVCFTDWIWHLSSQRGWTLRPQHLLLRPRLSTLLTQASTPSAQRWSRGQCCCNKSSNTCWSPMFMHLVVHFTLHVCSVYLTEAHLAHAVAQSFNSSLEGSLSACTSATQHQVLTRPLIAAGAFKCWQVSGMPQRVARQRESRD